MNSNEITVEVSLADGNGPSMGEIAQSALILYLLACIFLDTALSLPPAKMPLYQIHRWAFVPEVDTEGPAFLSEPEENHQECKPHTVRILELLQLKYGEIGSDEVAMKIKFPLLCPHSVFSIRQLVSFFKTLNYVSKTQNKVLADPEDFHS